MHLLIRVHVNILFDIFDSEFCTTASLISTSTWICREKWIFMLVFLQRSASLRGIPQTSMCHVEEQEDDLPPLPRSPTPDHSPTPPPWLCNLPPPQRSPTPATPTEITYPCHPHRDHLHLPTTQHPHHEYAILVITHDVFKILSWPTLIKFLYQPVLTRRMYWALFVDNFIVLSKDISCIKVLCNPVGWRLQPARGPRAFGSPPPMSSRHRNSEPLGRWDATIYLLKGLCIIYKRRKKRITKGKGKDISNKSNNQLCFCPKAIWAFNLLDNINIR